MCDQTVVEVTESNELEVVPDRNLEQYNPVRKVMHLKKGNMDALVQFATIGRATTCTVMIEKPGQGKPTILAGAAVCSPEDDFDLRIGMRLAAKRALQIGESWWNFAGYCNKDEGKELSALYHGFYRAVRVMLKSE